MQLVSVVIPSHSRSGSILRAVESALQQTYGNIEVIVVDDNGLGSDEQVRTQSALQRQIDAGSVRYVPHAENEGANAARNTGVASSRGAFIAFLDDDDEWIPEKLALQVAVAQGDDRIGVVYGRMIIRYDDFGLEYVTRPSVRGYIHDVQLLENYVGAMSSVLIRREALLENPLDETLPARQDYDLWIRISRRWRFELLHEVVAIVHATHAGTRISSTFENYVKAVGIINAKYATEVAALSRDRQVKREAEQLYFLGSQAIKANLPRRARAYFLKSILRKPGAKALVGLLSSLIGVRAAIYVRALRGPVLSVGTRR